MSETSDILRFNSSRFGEIEVPKDKILHVPEGIIGFPDDHNFAILDASGRESLFLWLQSTRTPDLAFIITDPFALVGGYRIMSDEPALVRINIDPMAPPAIFAIATIPEDNPDRVSINLMAPLIYFAGKNLLYQIVLEKEEWPLRHYLFCVGEEKSQTHEEVR
jgi:flagellar assembly factor FliW